MTREGAAEATRADGPSQGRPEDAARERSQERPIGMRLAQVAHYLGMSRSSLNRLREQRKFPAPRKVIGRLMLWHREDVDRWFLEDQAGRRR